MKERKVTINMAWANAFSFIVLAVAAIPTLVAYRALWGEFHVGGGDPYGVLIKDAVFVVAMLAGIVVHELIHGATWAMFAQSGWKSISFGVMWKMLSPYCHCSEPLPLRHYVAGALMPLVVLGIIPLALGLALESFLVVLYGVVFVSAASGDILVVWKLRHDKATSSVLDHPTEAGCVVYEEP